MTRNRGRGGGRHRMRYDSVDSHWVGMRSSFPRVGKRVCGESRGVGGL